ncbi:hypothetical protein SDRG_16251 [Saprolegnia diclina VS20]|uniref:Cytochrome P450 n=1 Tax=Saprolegnia diclina (strain VS20) TaxID=1156394 RepID=T0R1K1_SAPDV|nr:hypothetical protein SDRG_16251 [Saprolegnia diclina VS20]EQC25878.1 hypothetical protein SDRG_16251 [Saprolegnia diclina VS20]|eukprot:XP_008620674.1 hypothetical protein SDRG_16251 [Saprolegnia diclina VS20]
MTDLVTTASVGIALAALAIAYLYHRYGRNEPFVPGLAFPHELHAPFIGVAKHMGKLEASARVFVDAADANGMVSFKLMSMHVIAVTKAEHVRAVVCSSSYRKPMPLIQKHIRELLGYNSLPVLMHDEWKVHRRVFARAFHWEYLAAMVPAMATVAAEAASVLLAASTTDVYRVLQLSALDTIALTGFGFNVHALRDSSHPIAEAFEFLLSETTRRCFEAPLRPTSYFYSIPTPANLRYRREVGVVRAKLGDIIAARLASPTKGHPDLLQALLDAAAAEDDPMSPDALADNVLAFFFGGYDTTSTGMAYTLYLLATHPEVQAKAVAEIDTVVGMSGAITYEVLQLLPYLNAVLTESLRLFPPTPVTSRHLETDLVLSGYTIPAGTMAYLPIWYINRSTLNWGNDALDFKPERHLTDHMEGDVGAKDRAYRFMSFSGGPRNCVGMRFAVLEATCMLIAVLQTCVLARAEGSPPLQPKARGIVQKPELGVWLQLSPRLRPPPA